MIELGKQGKIKLLMVLSLFSLIGPLAVTMYLPAFGTIASDFNTTDAAVHASLTTYLIGLTIGHLFYGPLIDKFGRRNLMFVILAIYTVATFLCALSPTIDWLIWSRFFLALGGCGGVVIARVIVKDYFDIEESAKFLSVLMLVMSLAPIVAPSIGGVIYYNFGWRYIFYSLVLLVFFIMFGIYYFLPPLKEGDISVKVGIIETINIYFGIFKNPAFLTFGVAGSLTYASLFAYISGSSHVYVDIFGFSEQHYSWAIGVNAAALIFGNQLNHLLLKKYSSKKITEVTFVFLCGVIIVLLMDILFKLFTPFVFMGFIFIFISLLGILNPNTIALALAPFTHKAGRASALIGSMQMGISALVSAVVGWLILESVIPMVICMAICAFGGLIMVAIYLNKQNLQSNK